MGYIFLDLITAFFGISFILGSAPFIGTGLVVTSVLILANQPSDRTLAGWFFLLALIGIVVGTGAPEYYGSLQY